MSKIFLAVLTALTAAAIMVACGASPVATSAKIATQVVAATPTQVVEAVNWSAHKAGPSYWSLPDSKAFKAVEYGCTLRFKKVSMPYGCVLVIDRMGGGYQHNGGNGPMGVVIPGEGGVTIYPANGIAQFVEAKAKSFSFVVIDERGAFLAQQFSTKSPQWNEGLLREFFVNQMAGDVETIWREGVSDLNNN